MRRWMTALSMAAALCITASAVYAGPACCASKKSKNDALKAKMVAAGNKTCATEAKTCSAENAFPAIERKFVVAGQMFDTEEQAWQGLADASEQYVKQYTSIACVVDGKVVYCDEKGNATCQSGNAATVALVSTKSDSCCKSGAAKVASTCSKTKASCDKAELAKSSTCDKTVKTTLVSAEDGDKPACCKAKLACCEEAKKAGKKGNCCAGEAKVASAAKSQCSKAKTAALVSADDKKSTCDKAAKASLVKADEKAGCCKSKTAALAKADDKAGCCKSKAALAKANDKSGCCSSKNATYRVAGRNYDSWDKAVAAHESAIAAMSNVKMAYLVNGTKVDCASKVCPMAKKAGQVKFVVGETTTGCELHARVELAKAQIDAISKAMEGDQVATR